MSPSLKSLYRMILGKRLTPGSVVEIKNFHYDEDGNFGYDVILEFNYTPVMPLEFIRIDFSLESK